MSSASATSAKREIQPSESMLQELDSIRALNSSLRAYLDHLRLFNKNLTAMNDNCKQLSNVNTQWVDTLNAMKR